MVAKKAIVLAAGLGTRLRPLDATLPKPLMPIWGESMLARTVGMLREAGVEEIAVNAHYKHEKIEAWCAKNGCSVSVEKEILGTGGALNALRGFIAGDPFWLVNGDIVLSMQQEGSNAFDCVGGGAWRAGEIGRCLVTTEGPRTIEVEPSSGFVTCWKSPDPGANGTFTYCGAALLSPDLLDYVAETGFSSIVQAYERAMSDGRFVAAESPEGLLWADAGTIDAYIELNTSGEDNAYGEIPQIAAASKAAGTEGRIEFIGARGSNRCFFRQGDAAIIVYDDEARAENARYASHGRWLKSKGINVPGVLADLPDEKTLVLEWGGAPREMSVDDYVKVVRLLARFHALAGEADLPALEEPFGPAVWEWERNLFAEYCLGRRYSMAMDEAVEEDLKVACARLDEEKRSLVHRDFQSSNILWSNGVPCIIDFQGMRLGPGSYDLASLLYDPYAELGAKAREALRAAYEKEGGEAGNLPFAAVERLAQALGAFGRLASIGKTEFSRYTMPALEGLLSAADEAGLDAIGALAEELIAKEEHFARGCAHNHACAGEGEA